MRNETSPAFTHALRIIAVCLRHLDPVSFGAYRLRRVRYRMLRNSGCKAHMTYPKRDKEIAQTEFKYVKPVSIRYVTRISGKQGYRRGDPEETITAAGKKLRTFKKVLRFQTA